MEWCCSPRLCGSQGVTVFGSPLPPIDLPDAETIRIFVWVAEELWEEAIGAIVLAVGAAVKRHP